MFFTNKFFYQKQKENFISFIKRVIDYLPSILIGLFVSTISVNFYGKENASIGPICTLICALKRQSFSIDNFPILALRVLLLGILATIAEQNLFFIVSFNFIVPFYIVYLFSDDFTPKNYFIYGFTYVILQSYNIPMSRIHIRIEAILIGLLISFLYLAINNFFTKHKKYNDFSYRGLKLINDKLLTLYNKSCPINKSEDIISIINEYVSEIYMDTLKRNNTMNNRNITHFKFILILEEINILIEKEYENLYEFTEKDSEYFIMLSKILERTSRILKHGIYKHEAEYNIIIKMINDFNSNYFLSNERSYYEWLYVIIKLRNILHSMFENNKDDFQITKSFNFKLMNLKKELSINKCHFRFSLKMGIIMCIAFTVKYFLPDKIATRGYWLPIISYMILHPFYEEQKETFTINILGNFIGVFIFAMFFKYIPNYSIMPIITICIILAMASNNQFFKKIYSTISALISSFPYMNKLVSISLRSSFMISAISIVWVFDNFIIKTENYKGLIDKISELIEIDTMLIDEMEKAINNEVGSEYLYEILLKAYMIKNNIIVHEQKQTRYKGTPIKDSLIENNRKFIVESEQLINLIRKYNRAEDKQNIRIFIENISTILENTAKIFKNEINDISNDVSNNKFTKKSNSYLIYRLEKCLNSINAINTSIKDNMDNLNIR
ncbi:FUSC family protein [Brachyspira intermedia]|uniref:FUSC family protein n=1 Tax=Brachyspira intermedia TaxID=84377 RepID=UPI0030051FD1